MALSPDEFVKRLQDISRSDGIPYGRTRLVTEEEQRYSSAVFQQYAGHFELSNAFKCFFLETVELLNAYSASSNREPVQSVYGFFVPRMRHAFHSLCGAERAAVSGYPLLAYTVLRNIFDNVILFSAALQKFTDFYSIEGVEPDKPPTDIASINKLRKKTERAVQVKMTGDESNLTAETRDELKQWDMTFDWEVHGARLSLVGAQEWIRGNEPLTVLPQFVEREFVMFINWYCEVAWMTHRLIPSLQLPGVPLSDAWKEKWRTLDDSFEAVAKAFEEGGKPIGAAIIELVKTKFPFNEGSEFPSISSA
ncbi:MAG: hypothetical protein AB7L09_03680 [Nitrospira sp.]